MERQSGGVLLRSRELQHRLESGSRQYRFEFEIRLSKYWRIYPHLFRRWILLGAARRRNCQRSNEPQLSRELLSIRATVFCEAARRSELQGIRRHACIVDREPAHAAAMRSNVARDLQ